MSKVTATSGLTREAMPDAPDGEWLDSLLEKTNIVDDQVIRVLQNGFSIVDNTPWKFIPLNMVHGVQYKVKNPFDDPSMAVKMITIAQATGLTLDSSGRPDGGQYSIMNPQIGWRPTGLPDNSVYITVQYDIAHTQPCLVATLSADQSIPHGAGTLVKYNSNQFVRGTVISNDLNGTFTVSEAGTYSVAAWVRWQGAVTYTGVQSYFNVASGTASWVGSYYPVAWTDGPYHPTAGIIQLPAGGNIQHSIVHSNAAVAARVISAAGNNGCRIEIHRLYNDTLPTARVTLLFQGA